MRKHTLILAAVAVMGFSMIFTGCGNDGKSSDSKKETTSASDDKKAETIDITDEDALLTGKHHAEIEIKDYGTIKVELDADVSPVTVTNFVNLANTGFYDGLTFHRIIKGFMIQGGDPDGNGTGGSDINIKGEFKSNGVENNISHVRGTISMARAMDYDSASSQFFIVQEDSTYLDGEYAAFGTVTEGMDIVDKICDDKKPEDESSGLVASDEQPVITTIKIVD